MRDISGFLVIGSGIFLFVGLATLSMNLELEQTRRRFICCRSCLQNHLHWWFISRTRGSIPVKFRDGRWAMQSWSWSRRARTTLRRPIIDRCRNRGVIHSSRIFAEGTSWTNQWLIKFLSPRVSHTCLKLLKLLWSIAFKYCGHWTTHMMTVQPSGIYCRLQFWVSKVPGKIQSVLISYHLFSLPIYSFYICL